ncbi:MULTISPECIES: anti-sigma regulatory factor [Amycolatopsis]|uniref:anti-sigma regulatory factor n=1 Tax=Amycolatopsis TaxID=1813 RepID=UPI0013BE8C2B|nr:MULTISPECIES: anti-sigma regulatory factor [Amycolatopsis]
MTSAGETLPGGIELIRDDNDLLGGRHAVRRVALQLGFDLVGQTMIVTAASELLRNAVVHGGGGTLSIETVVAPDGRYGVRLTVRDLGPGITDIAAAMADGYSTTGGLGHGLSGTRRMVDEFEIRSAPGEGTTATVLRWTR